MIAPNFCNKQGSICPTLFSFLPTEAAFPRDETGKSDPKAGHLTWELAFSPPQNPPCVSAATFWKFNAPSASHFLAIGTIAQFPMLFLKNMCPEEFMLFLPCDALFSILVGSRMREMIPIFVHVSPFGKQRLVD